MNTGFVVFGLLALPFAAAVHRALPEDPADRTGRVGRVGRALPLVMALTGVATIGAAVFPCSAGCPGPGSSLTDNGHAVTATIGYLALAASPLLVAARLRGTPGWGRTVTWSVLAGVLTAVGMAAWAFGLAGTSWGGALQRAFNTLADAWWAGLALTLRRRDGA